ncbi:hypothetical protein [Rubritalea tangerina]
MSGGSYFIADTAGLNGFRPAVFFYLRMRCLVACNTGGLTYA